MKIIISPAKNMRFVKPTQKLSSCGFPEETKHIHSVLKELDPWQLQSILKANDKIIQTAFSDIHEFSHKNQLSPALFAYDGLVYKNISPESLSPETLEYSKDTLRILSAFYGLLKPFDGVFPYRLEMGSPLKIEGESLYKFWGDKLYRELYSSENMIINLASDEYSKIIRKHLKSDDIFIDVDFLTTYKGKPRTIVAPAKMARGQMVRFILENQIDNISDIKKFEWNGYRFVESLSFQNKLVFFQN